MRPGLCKRQKREGVAREQPRGRGGWQSARALHFLRLSQQNMAQALQSLRLSLKIGLASGRDGRWLEKPKGGPRRRLPSVKSVKSVVDLAFTAGFLPRMTRMTRIFPGSAGQPSPHPLSGVGRLPTGANRRRAGEGPLNSQNENCGSRARGDLARHTWII